MIKISIFLLFVGIIATTVGIRFSDQGFRKIGVSLLVASLVIFFLGTLTNINLTP